MRYFAEINEEGTVVSIIIADQEFIDSGAVGNSSNWVETFNDGTRKQIAVVDGRWDSSNNVFIDRQEWPSWSLNSNFDWEPPVAHPDPTDGRYMWNETKREWFIPEDE